MKRQNLQKPVGGSVVMAIGLLCLLISTAIADNPKSAATIPAEVRTLTRYGYGAVSKGGDGGRVIWVTNLKI